MLRIRLAIGLLITAFIVGSGGPLRAQAVQVTLVDTFLTVMDKDGRFVKNLTKDDFTVLDNGEKLEIAKFDKRLESPLSLAVVIDRSMSVGEHFTHQQRAATEFVRAIMRAETDRGLVIAFDSKVYFLQDWSSEVTLIANAINKLTSAGGTSLFDAIYKTCRDKFVFDDPRKKILVLVTDGEDTTSRASFKQALEMAQLSGVTIYVIGVKAQESLNVRELQGKNVLQQLAEMTGGRVFYPAKDESIASLFSKLEDELRNQYNVSYYLRASLDGRFHNIRIETKSKDLKVHTRKGYYASISQGEPSE